MLKVMGASLQLLGRYLPLEDGVRVASYYSRATVFADLESDETHGRLDELWAIPHFL